MAISSRTRVFGAIVLLIASAAAASAHARDLRAADVYAPDTPVMEALQAMATQIQARTQGRYRITSFRASDTDSENFIIGQVRTGALDMARVSLQVFNSAVPSTAVLSAPYLFRSNARLRGVLDGAIGGALLDDLSQQGIVALCFYDLGARSIFTVDKQVRTASDLKGLRLRVQPGDLAATYLKQLGAEPVPVPFGQLNNTLRSRAIDAAMVNWMGFISSKQYGVARFFSPTEHARVPGVVIVSAQVWQGLSENDRSVFRTAARASVVQLRESLDVYEVQARRTAEIAGVKVLDDINVKSFSEPMAALYRSLFSNDRQQDLLKRIQAEGDRS